MDIEVLASGSKGNAYYVSDGETPLLLEAGIRFADIQKGLGFGISGLAGCLISHDHQDHSRAVRHLAKRGLDCYMTGGTAKALGSRGHRIRRVEALGQFQIGTWTVLPFDTIHDAEEPLGFLLVSGKDKLLYATDTAYIRYRFNGLTHIMIEANYSTDILRANVWSGALPLAQKLRVIRSHMSIQTVVGFLEANDLSRVQEIHLLHLSDGNSDAEGFKREIQGATGKVVRVP